MIEFHYCGMSPPDDSQATGGSATIGLESIDGSKGSQFSFNTASSAKTGTALRFVPKP